MLKTYNGFHFETPENERTFEEILKNWRNLQSVKSVRPVHNLCLIAVLKRKENL